jgi:hypothetical protein
MPDQKMSPGLDDRNRSQPFFGQSLWAESDVLHDEFESQTPLKLFETPTDDRTERATEGGLERHARHDDDRGRRRLHILDGAIAEHR